jgi:hypothetical protein
MGLTKRGFSEAAAEEVSTALLKGDLRLLGERLGLKLPISSTTDRLLPND